MSVTQAVTAIMLIVIVYGGVIAYSLSPAGTAGIQITHNGRPINNLEVRMYDPAQSSGYQLIQISTTDGTGLVTHVENNADMWHTEQLLYDFTYNGTTYSFAGPRNTIIVESV